MDVASRWCNEQSENKNQFKQANFKAFDTHKLCNKYLQLRGVLWSCSKSNLVNVPVVYDLLDEDFLTWKEATALTALL